MFVVALMDELSSLQKRFLWSWKLNIIALHFEGGILCKMRILDVVSFVTLVQLLQFSLPPEKTETLPIPQNAPKLVSTTGSIIKTFGFRTFYMRFCGCSYF